MHPLVSVSDPVFGAEKFEGAFFCLEGDAPAVKAAREIVAALRGHSFAIETSKKPLYHAAAVTASGHLVALVDAAFEMLSHCGIEGASSKEILLPLIRSTVENLERRDAEDALTGSYARGDHAAIERHLASLSSEVADDVLKIYLDLAERSLAIAGRKGISPEAAGKIRSLISIAKKNTEC
jgi:predicted short-subunit dehydrogenase-like oxidoreductase (DUF2520 family)